MPDRECDNFVLLDSLKILKENILSLVLLRAIFIDL